MNTHHFVEQTPTWPLHASPDPEEQDSPCCSWSAVSDVLGTTRNCLPNSEMSGADCGSISPWAVEPETPAETLRSWIGEVWGSPLQGGRHG